MNTNGHELLLKEEVYEVVGCCHGVILLLCYFRAQCA